MVDAEKLERLASAVRTGGRGSVRRKGVNMKQARAVSAHVEVEDFKGLLRRVRMQTADVDQMKLFHADGRVTTFSNPRVMLDMKSNAIAVCGSGHAHKATQEDLRDMIEFPGLAQTALKLVKQQEDIPELVSGNFEDVANAEEENGSGGPDVAVAAA